MSDFSTGNSAASSNEQLYVQPIVIPRKFQRKTSLLEFFVVFSFTREPTGGPARKRSDELALVPNCLSSVDNPWPSYIDRLFKAPCIYLNHDDTPIAQAPTLNRPFPSDLQNAGWSLQKADSLWKELVVPLSETSASHERPTSSGAKKLISLSPAPASTSSGQINLADFDMNRVNGWVATDLRPDRRLESVNTRRVAREVNSFIASETQSNRPPLETLKLFADDAKFVGIVAQRDSTGTKRALLKSVKDSEPRFLNVIFPRLAKTEKFKQQLEELRAMYSEYLLASPRSEFLRQSRFVQSGQHRSLASGTISVASGSGRLVSFNGNSVDSAEWAGFEEQMARWRQHSGLMRRLYLTVKCTIPIPKSIPSIGTIGIFLQDGDTFVRTMPMTNYTLAISQGVFRARALTPSTFGIRSGSEQDNYFNKYHIQSPNMYLVSQDDPAQAMLRANFGVSDSFQSNEDERRDELGGGVLETREDARYSINAVNIYSTPKNVDGEEISVAEFLFSKAKQSQSQLLSFRNSVQKQIAERKLRQQTLVSTEANRLIDSPIRHQLFWAEHLMMGCSVWVQTLKEGKPDSIWRSLCRRIVTVEGRQSKNPFTTFEEEGFLSTSVTVPPRPVVGYVTEISDHKLIVTVLGAGVATQKAEFQLDKKVALINSFSPFASNLKHAVEKNDLVLIVAVPAKANDSTNYAAEIWSYPCLKSKSNSVFKNRIHQVPNGWKILPFEKPILIDCEIERELSPGAPASGVNILYSPFITRLVKMDGSPIEPDSTLQSEDSNHFEMFTVEAAARHFAQSISRQITEPFAHVITNLGPINLVNPAHTKSLTDSDSITLPVPTGSLFDPPSPFFPLDRSTLDSRRVERVSIIKNTKLFAQRGWVSKIEFELSVLVQNKPDNAFSQPIAIGGQNWYSQPISLGAGLSMEVSQSLSLPATIAQARIVLRGDVSEDPSTTHTNYKLTATSMAYSVPNIQSSPLSKLFWIVHLERLDKTTSKVYVPSNLELVRDARWIHPTDCRGRYVEFILPSTELVCVSNTWPQYVLGTLRNGEVLFPGGGKIELSDVLAGPYPSPTSGFLSIARSGENAVLEKVVESSPLYFALEISSVSENGDTIEAEDLFNQKWLFKGQADIDIPLKNMNHAIRKFKSLVPGEWIVAACDCEVPALENSRCLVLRKQDEIGQAFSVLAGRFRTLGTQVVTSIVEGTTQFELTNFRSVLGREFKVLSDRGTSNPSVIESCWSTRMLVADTITERDNSTTFRSTRQSDAVRSSDTPQHVMVSELICRWANWSLVVPQPGATDQQLGEDRSANHAAADSTLKSKYLIKFSLPDLGPGFVEQGFPFTRNHWKLPTLRFGKSYRFCLRHVDLAGNHLYDEEELPKDIASEDFCRTLAPVDDSTDPEVGEQFVRAHLPAPPILAHEPNRLFQSLPPKTVDSSSNQAAKQDYVYRTSSKREQELVLLTDILNKNRQHVDDAQTEVMPPSLDVETLLMHGFLDHMSGTEAAALIASHESYLDAESQSQSAEDNSQDSTIFGRRKFGLGLNFIPDPFAKSLGVGVFALNTSPESTNSKLVNFFDKTPGSSTLGSGRELIWPNIRWIRIALRSTDRQKRRGRESFPLRPPVITAETSAATITVHLPPGIKGNATLSVRPELISDKRYSRMLRDHGSDQRKIKLIHATNGPWTSPVWSSIEEVQPNQLFSASTNRRIKGEFQLDRLTTGAFRIHGYWNDSWDEMVPAQFEPAHGVVELDRNGRPVECKLLTRGHGFGSQAIVQYDQCGLSYRKPKVHPVLRDCKVVGLNIEDAGISRNVEFRIYVVSAQHCCHCLSKNAVIRAYHSSEGRLIWEIISPGAYLGPTVEVFIVAERATQPPIAIELEGGSVKSATMIGQSTERFSQELHFYVYRRPPFYRIADAEVVEFTKQGGIAKIHVKDGGGWYRASPFCVLHDPSGNGFGAELEAKLDEEGGVCRVEILSRGRHYSSNTRIRFYTDLFCTPEVLVDEPSYADIDDNQSFDIQQSFPSVAARCVDYTIHTSSRFRSYLSQEKIPSSAFASDKPFEITFEIPRISPERKVDIVSHRRPDAPEIEYMMPAFEWETISPKDELEIEPSNYFVDGKLGLISIRRQPVIRLYMHRPWNLTGPESLGIVVAPAITNTSLRSANIAFPAPENKADDSVHNPVNRTNYKDGLRNEPVEGYAIPDEMRDYVSRCGYDPVWDEKSFPPLTLDHFPNRRAETIYDEIRNSTNTAEPQSQLIGKVGIAIHDVRFDSVKDLWFSDVRVETNRGVAANDAVPFVSLVAARYQENGVPGNKLSQVRELGKFKLLGHRDLHVKRIAERSFLISLEGVFDTTPKDSALPRRDVIVRLEARDADLDESIVEYSLNEGFAHLNDSRVLANYHVLPVIDRDSRMKYLGRVQITEEAWRSALRFRGKTSVPALSILEYEVYPTSESQADSTGTQLVMVQNRLAVRKLVYSQTFRLK